MGTRFSGTRPSAVRKGRTLPTIQTRNPATGETLETYETTSEAEVFAKIEVAHAAFLDWRKTSHEDRAPYLRRIAASPQPCATMPTSLPH